MKLVESVRAFLAAFLREEVFQSQLKENAVALSLEILDFFAVYFLPDFS